MDLNTEFRIKWPRGEMGAYLMIAGRICF